MDDPPRDPRRALSVLLARYQEAVDDPGAWTGHVEGMPARIEPQSRLDDLGLARGLTIAVSTGDPRKVASALARPGITGLWQGFDTLVATWVRPARHPDLAQLSSLLARGAVPWFHDIEASATYQAIVPGAVVEDGGRVDWHAWRGRVATLVARPALSASIIPWRGKAGLPRAEITGPLYQDQARLWIAIINPSAAQLDAMAGLACCFPVATVSEGTGTLHAVHGTRASTGYVVIDGILPGGGIVSALDVIGTSLAGKLDLPGDRFVVVPPADPLPIEFPPGYPATDPANVFSRDAAGNWRTAPSMDKGRTLSLAEQWEVMRR